MTTLRIGIATYEEMKARTVAIARGAYNKPKKDEPKVWFISMESVARVLSDKNRALLSLIATEQPASITELAKLSGRAKPNLSRTLKTMAGYGLVQLNQGASGKVAPVVPYSEIVLDLPVISRRQAARKVFRLYRQVSPGSKANSAYRLPVGGFFR